MFEAGSNGPASSVFRGRMHRRVTHRWHGHKEHKAPEAAWMQEKSAGARRIYARRPGRRERNSSHTNP